MLLLVLNTRAPLPPPRLSALIAMEPAPSVSRWLPPLRMKASPVPRVLAWRAMMSILPPPASKVLAEMFTAVALEPDARVVEVAPRMLMSPPLVVIRVPLLMATPVPLLTLVLA